MKTRVSEAKAVAQDRNAAAYEITAAVRNTFKLGVKYCSFKSAIVLYGSGTQVCALAVLTSGVCPRPGASSAARVPIRERAA